MFAICNVDEYEKARQNFKLAQAQYKNNQLQPEQYRKLARAYINEASLCYNSRARVSFGASGYNSAKIDDGGVWMPGSGGNTTSAIMTEEQLLTTLNSQPFVLHGTKWETSSVPSPGGVVSYSFMANGVDNSAESATSNVAISSLPGFQVCFIDNIRLALSAWSAISNISFVEVTDNGVPFDNAGAVGDIRIGAHVFDGVFGTLAHAFFPPPNSASAAGDMHFDVAENWSCSPAGGSLDFGIVALHEAGHSIGLGHEPTISAVMNPIYDPTITGLRQDDINGAVTIYGSTGKSRAIVYTPSTPCRIVDTRFDGVGKFFPGEIANFTINGDTSSQGGSVQCNLPDGIAKPSAVVFNITSTGSTTSGFLTVWPSLLGRPNASILNYTAGRDVANSAVIPISTASGLEISVFASAQTHVIIDIMGYYRAADLP